MGNEFKIKIILHSGQEALFENILAGEEYQKEIDGIKLSVGNQHPYTVTATPASKGDPIK